jgi:sugar phosphate isomerase/epimerase
MPPQASSADVQCSTGPFWAWPLEAALDAVAASGFSSIELMVTRDRRTQAPGAMQRLVDERGLEIATVHAPFLMLTRGVWGWDPLAKIEKGIELCGSLGARTLIVHPPLAWEQSYARWLRSREEGDDHVTIAVENMYPRWVRGRRVKAYRWTDPRELLASAPHVALDVSHLTVARHDVLAGYDLLQPKLVHVHLSNNRGDGRDSHLSLDEGVIPMDALLARMRRTHYAGGVSLELSVRRYLEHPKELVNTLRRNREYVQDRLSARGRAAKDMPGP